MLPLDTRAIQIEMTGDESGESGANHSSIPHRHVFQCVYEVNAVLHFTFKFKKTDHPNCV